MNKLTCLGQFIVLYLQYQCDACKTSKPKVALDRTFVEDVNNSITPKMLNVTTNYDQKKQDELTKNISTGQFFKKPKVSLNTTFDDHVNSSVHLKMPNAATNDDHVNSSIPTKMPNISTSDDLLNQDELAKNISMNQFNDSHRDDKISNGIVNLGQTCWFGIVMQLFYHTDPAREIVKMKQEDINNLPWGRRQLSQAFKIFLEEMANGSGQPVHPEQLLQEIRQIHNDSYYGDLFINEAQDVIEAWNSLLYIIEEDLIKNILQSFSVEFLRIASFLDNGYCAETKRDGSSNLMSVDVPKQATNLSNQIETFTSEHTDPEWPVSSDKCPNINGSKNRWGRFEHKNWTKQYLFSANSTTKYLTFQLKRFDYDWDAGKTVYIDTNVTFPIHLNMDDYIHQKPDNVNYDYTIHAVVEFLDIKYRSYGHYHLYVRSRERSNDVNNWIKYNDEEVSWVSQEEAMDRNFGGKGDNSWAYLLMYKKDS